MVGLDSIIYSGNHGAEWLENGAIRAEEAAMPLAQLIQGLAADVQREFADYPGVLLEDKGLALSVHYRSAHDREAARAAILKFMAGSDKAAKLEVDEGRMDVEVRPGAGLSKGAALRSLCERDGLKAVLVIGDERTDAEAFRVVEQLRGGGTMAGLSVAVISGEAPDELIEAADYALDGTGAVEEFLQWLAAAAAG